MATHKMFGDPSNELRRINDAMAELKMRAAQVRARSSVRERLLDYCKKYGLHRTDLMAVIQRLPLTRITKRSREARLHAVREKHAPRKAKPPHGGFKPENVKFGAKLRAAREAKELTKAEVAKHLGMHHSMMYAWESGRWRCKPEHVVRLSKLYGVELTQGG